jgi:hypothetical protein
MSNTQTKIREIACKKFRKYMNEAMFIHSKSSKIAQTARSGLRSSLSIFHHQFHTLLNQRQLEIEKRKLEWDKARAVGLKFSTLEDNCGEIAKKLKLIEV